MTAADEAAEKLQRMADAGDLPWWLEDDIKALLAERCTVASQVAEISESLDHSLAVLREFGS